MRSWFDNYAAARALMERQDELIEEISFHCRDALAELKKLRALSRKAVKVRRRMMPPPSRADRGQN